MNALDVLTQRVSAPQLTGPEPTAAQIETLLRAALRAPDHAWLRPSRYLLIRGEQRRQLGEIFLQGMEDAHSLSAEKQEKSRNLLTRAPLVIAAVTRVVEHDKVPRDEQLLSTGAGVQNLLNASWALGLGAIWRTGAMASSQAVHQALGLQPNDVLVGFVYVGQVNCRLKQAPELELSDYVSEWTGKPE
ncbi:nitroreductase [Bacterioplanes sanyensis]|uniref:Putative NAD(P)H nitroreductase n=1 Tax=Bacterioplanes sanyensis TaxID=1249553 RepID=A0A222FLF2_9GAMM|nr:nitroreductase [Bacterioplanes sanyensis]ASP39589.1 nitroreductase [Bacterioplanes sanyensis]